MDLILGAIRATKSEIFVPGESTSSISECIDVLPAGAVNIYENTAMNKVHQAHVKSEVEAGRVKLMPMGYQAIIAHQNASEENSKPKRSAAETIALVLSQQTE